MSRADIYRAAVANAEAKRALFLASADAARQRIAPARLKADVKDAIGHSVNNAGVRIRTTVRDHPVATGAVGISLVAWMARRPLTALFRRLYVRLVNRNPEIDDG